MLKLARIPLIAIGLLAAQFGMTGHAAAQSERDAYAKWYAWQCELQTGNYRPICFDMLSARTPGLEVGHSAGAAANPSASTPASAQAAAPQKFIGTAAKMPAHPFSFLEDYNP